MAGDGDDAVYASILAQVEPSELHNQLHKVVRKEYKSINRLVRHALSSLTALRQLQAASEHLRPHGDWLPTTMQTQLKSIEELQSRLETAIDLLEMDVSDRRTKKRKRPHTKKTVEADEEDEEVVVVDVRGPLSKKEDVDRSSELESVDRGDTTALEQEEGSDVECLEAVDLAKKRTEDDTDIRARSSEKSIANRETTEQRAEKPIQEQQETEDYDVEIVEMLEVDQRRAETDGGGVSDNAKEQSESRVGSVEDMVSESEELPCGLVRITHDAEVRIKDEPMTLADDQIQETSSPANVIYDTGPHDTVESPIELEVLESSDSEHSAMDMSDLAELAIELDVPDSDSEDDFTPCMELVAKLKDANTTDQLAKFPVVVERLRSYLVDHKHLTVTELDGYLFAHKHITEEEADEIGRAIEIIICMGMALPLRPKIRRALSDLLAVVQQLECMLGELPVFLRPVVENFSSYL
ncbi:hypothetical protein F441_05213 [Phytophthora nicotianae CJ01A1]|uniref:Uncharacterized protein n=1 Tax=Phytophthora nicotianae CJ01A1 TaxID=1317063 RepID=W2XEY7_PHYNI|nr:hypothetical protein F441_05213 [Phytophthora nicotianae CJ01A1]